MIPLRWNELFKISIGASLACHGLLYWCLPSNLEQPVSTPDMPMRVTFQRVVTEPVAVPKPPKSSVAENPKVPIPKDKPNLEPSLNPEAALQELMSQMEEVKYQEPQLDAEADDESHPWQAESVAAPRVAALQTAGDPDVLSNYLQQLHRSIKGSSMYPFYAETLGVQGTIMVRFEIGSQGEWQNLEFLNTTHPLLRQAIEEILQAAQLPELPTLLGDKLEIKLPISFQLDSDS